MNINFNCKRNIYIGLGDWHEEFGQELSAAEILDTPRQRDSSLRHIRPGAEETIDEDEFFDAEGGGKSTRSAAGNRLLYQSSFILLNKFTIFFY